MRKALVNTHPVNYLLFSFLLLFAWAFVPQQAAADEPTAAQFGTILNLSGRQRMLSQKMSKEVLLVSLNHDTAANIKNLQGTAGLFDKTLKGLRDGSAEQGLPATTSRRVLRQLDKVDGIWADLYPVIQAIVSSGAVTDEQLQTVATQNLPLLREMNKAVGQYEKEAKKGGLSTDPGLATTLNLSGKQRMLSQKMSKEFLMVAKGYQVEDSKLSLLETSNLFDQTLKGLKDGDDVLGLSATPQADIRSQLDVVFGLWGDFKPIVEQAADYKSTTVSADQVAKLAELNLPLLREMNKAVQMYEKVAAQ